MRPLRPGPAGAAALLLVGALAACGQMESAGPLRSVADARPSSAPECTPAPLKARAAVVLHVGLAEVTEPDDPLLAEVVDLGVGGIFVNDGNIEDEEQLAALVAGIREQAAGRPLLLSTDEEAGRVSDFRSLIGGTPSPRRLASRSTPAQVRAFAADLGAQLREHGVDLDLAPLLDLDAGRSDGIIGDRAFSGDPDEAAEYGLAFARGLDDAGVIPTVKHFPGHGRSTTDTHREGTVVDATLEELRETDLAPFQEAVDAGAPVVMLNHLSYAALDPDLPASMSPRTYALLRDMGFDGVAMTDSIGMGAIYPERDFPEAAVDAIAAGADTVLASGAVLRVDPTAATRMRDALVDAVRDGRLPESRLDEAAARVVALAGGDPVAFACVEKTVPVLQDDPATATADTPATPATTSATATPAPARSASPAAAPARAPGAPAPATTSAAPSRSSTPSPNASASPSASPSAPAGADAGTVSAPASDSTDDDVV
ncbi:MAG TPA: glycoside hydrolase family 3 N-terminal domain-containing protein, partial [Mycobacteriales bacterium]|nr:glycoside hydrolase family 3 N-terminal domain-containing protein [Mycobacteriales bacterium]